MIGKEISHYKILEELGRGGMGVVYKAEDTKLKRTVALKFLSPALTSDSEARHRIVREAQAAAALSHPNICTIHEIGEAEDQIFISMEYVEGQSLKDRIGSGPMKLGEVVDLATQIAQGLHEAHEKGIVHRDIKSANIMVTPKGRAKIMDFGLARSSTQTRLTKEHTTLGTFHYMSPEQTQGEDVDYRTDIWSLGVVLYEMIAGQLPFKGDYEQAVMYSILNEDPEPLTALRTGVPMDLERIVWKLLAKDPADRYQHVDEMPVDLRSADLGGMGTSRIAASTMRRAPLPPPPRSRRTLPWSVAALLLVGAFIAGAVARHLVQPEAASQYPSARMVMAFPPDASPAFGSGDRVALSPDGRRLVYSAEVDGIWCLFLRELDRLETRTLPGTEGGGGAFFSPDGQWVGFFAGNKLKKLHLSGGRPIALCESFTSAGCWGPDGTIFYVRSWSEGLWRIPAGGGEPVQVTVPDSDTGEYAHMWPEILPGGEAVLFTVWHTSINDSRIAVLSLKSGEQRCVVTGGTCGRYSPTGHLLYGQSGTMVAAPFDLTTLTVGEPHVPVLENLSHDEGNGNAAFSVSQSGLLCYVLGNETLTEKRLVWVDRQGNIEPLSLPPGAYAEPCLSPDEERLALTKYESGSTNLWIHEFGSGTTRQLTFESSNFGPIWTPDGDWLAFTSFRLGPFTIFRVPLDRHQPEQLFHRAAVDVVANSCSPDGRNLLFTKDDGLTGTDVWLLPVEDRDHPQRLLAEPGDELGAIVHPGGRWFAYASDASGRSEVFVRPFPEPGGVTPVSTDGGSEPRWSRDGSELFYRNGDKMMAVEVLTQPEFHAGQPTLLFESDDFRAPLSLSSYDVASDGRFLMIESTQDEASTDLVLVFNWFKELEAKFREQAAE
jgi:serine/threonine-protein kinase